MRNITENVNEAIDIIYSTFEKKIRLNFNNKHIECNRLLSDTFKCKALCGLV